MDDKYPRAHSLGDAYYKLVTTSLRVDGKVRKECLAKAVEYLDALNELKSDLLAQDPVPHSDVQRTLGYIDLVTKDIKLFNGKVKKSA